MQRGSLLSVALVCAGLMAAGAASAAPLSQTLDPNALGLGDTSPPIAPINTAGGDAGIYMGIKVGATTGSNVSYSAWGSVQINNFLNSTLTAYLDQNSNAGGTGLNFDSSQGWQFFMTVSMSGQGDWTGGTFNSDPGSTVSMNLWGLQGGSTASFGLVSTTPQTDLGTGNFSDMGITNGTNAILLATGTEIAGNEIEFSDIANQNPSVDAWSLAITLALNMVATNPEGLTFFSLDEFPLFIRTGCVEGTAAAVPLDKESADTFRTPNQGESTCTSDGRNRDKALWDFGATADVPEPMTIAVLGLGLLGLAGMRRRRH